MAKSLPALSSEKARELINVWAKSSFFRLPGLGDRITIEEIVPKAAYAIYLDTEYEERTVTEKAEPHIGGALEVEGVVPDPWDVPVQRPTEFENRSEEIPLPNSQRVQRCGTCAGKGKVRCATCAGSGKVNCTWCHGRGYRVETKARNMLPMGGVDRRGRPLKDRAGMPLSMSNSRMPFVEVREECRQCSNGKVTCAQCQGRCEQTCSTCGGSGRTVVSRVLTVKFRHEARTAVVNPTQVAPEQIQEEPGDVLVEARNEKVSAVEAPTTDVGERIGTLVQESRSEQNGSRVLLERLRVTWVPVHEVAYRYRGRSLKRLSIYGTAAKVHAPRAPRPWGRIAVLVGALIALLSAILVAMR